MESNYTSQSRVLWTPPYADHSSVEVLRRDINRKHGLKLENYHDLHKYSVEDYTFWIDLWNHLRVVSSIPPDPTRILEDGAIPEVPMWFPGARLNYAENLLHRRDDAVAIIAAGEDGIVQNFTFRELHGMVQKMTSALRANGLQVGDRVAAIVTNHIHAVVICLAVASIGGVFSSTATDMGTQGILDRYSQIQPKFVFAETEVSYGGKTIDLLPKIRQVVEELKNQGLQKAILLPSRVSGKSISLAEIAECIPLTSFLESGDNAPLRFEQLPFNHPLFILYSSGTSGKPKCIVHSAGGVLLQTWKELRLGDNLGPDDTYFQYTTTGWMMWTLMLSGLACGARLVLYDGSPFYPNVETYLRFINDQGVTMLGTSPRFLSEVQGKGLDPLSLGSFKALRVMLCTGAVLTPPMFDWTQKAFGGKLHLVSTSGGTDICSSFVTGCPTLPVHSGEIQSKSLGMKVEVFDALGNNIEHTGEPGELVCTRPHVSLPLGFWGDHNYTKFRDSYFNMYPGIWRQGDFIVVNPKTKGLMILGRSDGVLNPSGVRFGSGEIYTVLEEFSKTIDDSLCIGQRRAHDKDERVLLFLKMRSGHRATPKLLDEIQAAIRKSLSARHVPAYIFEIEDIPYTVNGKKIEIAVKQIVSGSNLQPSGTVANPDSLKLYYKYRDIERVLGVDKAKL